MASSSSADEKTNGNGIGNVGYFTFEIAWEVANKGELLHLE